MKTHTHTHTAKYKNAAESILVTPSCKSTIVFYDRSLQFYRIISPKKCVYLFQFSFHQIFVFVTKKDKTKESERKKMKRKNFPNTLLDVTDTHRFPLGKQVCHHCFCARKFSFSKWKYFRNYSLRKDIHGCIHQAREDISIASICDRQSVPSFAENFHLMNVEKGNYLTNSFCRRKATST